MVRPWSGIPYYELWQDVPYLYTETGIVTDSDTLEITDDQLFEPDIEDVEAFSTSGISYFLHKDIKLLLFLK